MPGHLVFPAHNGDCHIKYGHINGEPHFVIKVATGFYNNPALGLPSSDGLMLVMSATTGTPLALLRDNGWLTNARTAAAGVLAVEAAHRGRIDCLGIVGAGLQAELQARWICQAHEVKAIALWGRNFAAAQKLAASLQSDRIAAVACRSIREMAARSEVIVTCTPSTEPLFPASAVRPGHRVVAMGADTYGKQELATAIVPMADTILCDDIAQCLDHGEIHTAEREGMVDRGRLISLGDALGGTDHGIVRDGVTLVDLTGIPAQDIAVAGLVYRLLCLD